MIDIPVAPSPDAGGGDNFVRNVNPPSQTAPDKPSFNNPKKPDGTVFESRKLADLIKSTKNAKSDTNINIKGVNPSILTRYVNQNLKQSPYVGIPYNKKMLDIAINNMVTTKSISDNLKMIAKGSVISSKNIISSIDISKKLISEQKKPNSTTKVLDQLVKETVSENRRKILKEREQQKTAGVNFDELQEINQKETNALLRGILKEDREISKGKKKGSILGMFDGLKDGLKDAFANSFLKASPLFKTALVAAAAVSAAEIVRAVRLGIQAIKDSKNSEKKIKSGQDAERARSDITAEHWRDLGIPKETIDKYTAARTELTNLTTDLTKPKGFINMFLHPLKGASGRFEEAIKLGLVKKSDELTLHPETAENMVKKAIAERQLTIDNLNKEIQSNLAQSETGLYVSEGAPSRSKYALSGLSMGPSIVSNDKMSVIKTINDLYGTKIEQEANKYGLDSSIIKGVMAQESKGNPFAKSKTGVKGLMQFTRDTGRAYGLMTDEDRLNPEKNIEAGAHLLSDLLTTTKGDLPKALAIYNAGTYDFDKIAKTQGKKKLRETSEYVVKVPEWINAFKSVSPEIDRIQATQEEIKRTQDEKKSDSDAKHAEMINSLNAMTTAQQETNNILGGQKINQVNRQIVSLTQ
jgi:hypothetical protein